MLKRNIYKKKYKTRKTAKDKKPKKYAEFLRLGGSRSGVYDISNKETAMFVKKYREFIPKNEIYKRNKKGWLVPVYKLR